MTEQSDTQTPQPLFIQLQNERKAAEESKQLAEAQSKEQFAKQSELMKNFVDNIFKELKIIVPAEIDKTMDADTALLGHLHYQVEKFFVTVVSNINGHSVTVKLVEPQQGESPVLEVSAGKITQLRIGRLSPLWGGYKPVLEMGHQTFIDATAIKDAIIMFLANGKFETPPRAPRTR